MNDSVTQLFENVVSLIGCLPQNAINSVFQKFVSTAMMYISDIDSNNLTELAKAVVDSYAAGFQHP